MNDIPFDADFTLNLDKISQNEGMNPSIMTTLTQCQPPLRPQSNNTSRDKLINSKPLPDSSSSCLDLSPFLLSVGELLTIVGSYDGFFLQLYHEESLTFINQINAQLDSVKTTIQTLGTPHGKLIGSLYEVIYHDGALTQACSRISTLIDSHSQFLSLALFQMNAELNLRASVQILGHPEENHTNLLNDLFYETSDTQRGQNKKYNNPTIPPQQLQPQYRFDFDAIRKLFIVTMAFMTFVENIYKNQSILLASLFTLTNGILFHHPQSPISPSHTAFPQLYLPNLPPSLYFSQLLTFLSFTLPVAHLPEALLASSTGSTSPNEPFDDDKHCNRLDIDNIFGPGKEKIKFDPDFSIYQYIPHISSRLYAASGLHPSAIVITTPSIELIAPQSRQPWANTSITTHPQNQQQPPTSSIFAHLVQFQSPFIPFNFQHCAIDTHYYYLNNHVIIDRVLERYNVALQSSSGVGDLTRMGGGGRASRNHRGFLGNNLTAVATTTTSSSSSVHNSLLTTGFGEYATRLEGNDDPVSVAQRIISLYTNLPFMLTTHTYRIALLFGQYDLAFVMGSSIQSLLVRTQVLGAAHRSLMNQCAPQPIHLSGGTVGMGLKKQLELQLWFLGIITGLTDLTQYQTQRGSYITRVSRSGIRVGAMGFDQRSPWAAPSSAPPGLLQNSLSSLAKTFTSYLTNTTHVMINNVLIQPTQQQRLILQTNNDNESSTSIVTSSSPPSSSPSQPTTANTSVQPPLLMNHSSLTSTSSSRSTLNFDPFNTPHLGVEMLPSVLADLKIESSGHMFNQVDSDRRGLIKAKRPLTNHARKFFQAMLVTSIESPQYSFLSQLFPQSLVPFSLLYVTKLNACQINRHLNRKVQQDGPLTFFQSQPHLFYQFQNITTTLLNHFKSMEIQDFNLFTTLDDDKDMIPAPQPTSNDWKHFFTFYNLWSQNKAFYPSNAPTVPAYYSQIPLNINSPLQIFTQGPVYIQSNLVMIVNNHANRNDNNNDDNDNIITFDLYRSKISSLPSTLASAALLMDNNANQEVIGQLIIKHVNEHCTQLSHYIEHLKSLHRTSGKRNMSLGTELFNTGNEFNSVFDHFE